MYSHTVRYTREDEMFSVDITPEEVEKLKDPSGDIWFHKVLEWCLPRFGKGAITFIVSIELYKVSFSRSLNFKRETLKCVSHKRVLTSYVGYNPWFATNISIIIQFWRHRMRLYLILHDILQDWIADPKKSNKYIYKWHISDSFFILHFGVCRSWPNCLPIWQDCESR